MADPITRDGARAACRRALEESPLRPLWDAARAGSSRLAQAATLLPNVQTAHGSVPRLRAIRRQLDAAGMPVRGGAFERFLVVAAAAKAADRVAHLPIDERVKELFYRKFSLYATGASHETFDVDRGSFVAMAGVATLRRFPAGQLDWVVSGVPRSWLLRLRPADLPRFVRVVVLELGGFAPAFFSHLDPTRPNHATLLERESLRSYHRMAQSMERQPSIKGLITASWFHSPDTFVVSPHLAWANDVFRRHGGHVFQLGAVDPDCGVFHRSPERRQAFERGAFTPTEALVIWPRSAMLAWAAEHQDLGGRSIKQASRVEARA